MKEKKPFVLAVMTCNAIKIAHEACDNIYFVYVFCCVN